MTKTFESLIPSIEARESGWMRIRERLAHPHQVPSHPSVTISRQYGCEGYSLAQRLKVLLEEASGQSWNLFDKALVDKVASDERLSRQLLGHLGDESHAQDVLRAHFGHLTHDDAYAKLVEHLVQIATAGCAIIVGRGGAVVCQDLKNCFHFRLEGSFDFRVATLARRLEVSPAEAEKLVRTQSKLREKFIGECLHADITAPHWYDAVFNNERQKVETIAQACLRIVISGWPDQDCFKHDPLRAVVAARS
ncbi:AAA family ATPase [Geothrix edaphica]|uniref:Cytidylate kinase n=1 Tax=Geothrix edaphica TaxID=2927976 RepID=A0ABQ5PTK2_9BACT|nr:cytidylate kinase-like family protein [Geothrix edaphica]GLH65821.1 cytidylate kinase [Geothrix edaphica]